MNHIVLETQLPGGSMLRIVQGDLTDERVDAIVNAANAHLAHGGGVAGAIVRRGGQQIQLESDEWVRANGPVPHHTPAFTTGGKLPFRFVIHAVGPVWGSGEEDRKLAEAVQGALNCAGELGLETIAMPAISTGIFGFPKARAAMIILDSIRKYFQATPTSSLRAVHLVLFDPDSVEVFKSTWEDSSDQQDDK